MSALPQGRRSETLQVARAPTSMAGLMHTILDHYRKPRVLGLDILRIVASLSIILYHANLTRGFGDNLGTALIHSNGYLAVDVFFVLSGWLLTRQVLRMRNSFTSSIGLAARFWTRRWARTLPPYWLMLVIIWLVWPWLDRQTFPTGPLGLSDLIRHALFLQTAIPPSGYGISWSLVAEEWFYLLLPFVILAVCRIRNWRLLAVLGALVLLAPTAIRAVLLTTTTLAPWQIETQPQARFDGLVIGALLAALSLGAPWWDKLVARRRLLFGLGLGLAAGILTAGLSASWGYNLFGVLGFSAAIGLLMPLMSQLRWPKGAPAVPVMGIAFLSELTYPLYLLHPMIRIHWTHFLGPMKIVAALLDVALLFLAAIVLHLAVERPFLALRERRERARPARLQGAVTVPARAPMWKEPISDVPKPTLMPEAAG